MAEPPSLPLVLQRVQRREGGGVVDEGQPRLPGQLHQPVADQREALAEVLVAQGVAEEDPSGGDVHLAHVRPSVLPRALVEAPVVDEQSLGVGLGVVGELAQQLVVKPGHGRVAAPQGREAGREGERANAGGAGVGMREWVAAAARGRAGVHLLVS